VQEIETDEDSIVATFADLARELRLPELDWNFLHEHGEVIVEGRPRATADLAACLRWARFLGMSPVHTDANGNSDCWLGVNGPWILEIFAEVS
jgi:hypothetical protein